MPCHAVPKRRHAFVVMFYCGLALCLAAALLPARAHAHGGWSTAAGERGGATLLFPAADALPDPRLTPGAIDPTVTQRNLGQTICRRGGYTRSVRPPESVTERLKRRQVRQYGYAQQVGHAGLRLRHYEEDHLVSLELGGSPADPRNLWPEPHRVVGGWGSHAKDRLESRLHTMVCRGQLGLTDAQRMIATNWIVAYKRYVGPAPSAREAGRARD